MDIPSLIDNTISKWKYSELSFPKGRKQLGEKDIKCAKREFFEETRLSDSHYTILPILPVEELFKGSNDLMYKHVYYLSQFHDNDDTLNPNDIKVDFTNIKQCGEVADLAFLSFKDAITLIRPYDYAKRLALLYAQQKIYRFFGG